MKRLILAVLSSFLIHNCVCVCARERGQQSERGRGNIWTHNVFIRLDKMRNWAKEGGGNSFWKSFHCPRVDPVCTQRREDSQKRQLIDEPIVRCRLLLLFFFFLVVIICRFSSFFFFISTRASQFGLFSPLLYYYHQYTILFKYWPN